MNCLLSGAIVRIGGAQKRADGVAGAKYSKSPQTPGVNVRLTSFTAVLSLNCLLKCSIFSSMLTLLSFASAEQ